MPNDNPETSDRSKLREKAISRWENEGGAGPCGPQESSLPTNVHWDVPEMSNADLVQLRIRVIALENVMITLLAGASDQQLDLVREMAGFITPRPGSTQHPLTVQAATEMVHLVERAGHFR